jgi:hypothetical protein
VKFAARGETIIENSLLQLKNSKQQNNKRKGSEKENA